MDKIQIFKKCSLFESLSSLELQHLVDFTIEKKFKRKDVIFQEGEKSSAIYVIAKGQVKSTKYTADGKELIIEIFGECEIVGQVAVFTESLYAHTTTALSDVETFVIRKEDFLTVLKDNLNMALKIINTLSNRVRLLQDKLQDLMSEKVEQRIAKILLTLSGKINDTIPFTRQDIASMVGTTIETAIRVTSRFKEGKIIKTRRGNITVINKEKLKLIAEGLPIKFR